MIAATLIATLAILAGPVMLALAVFCAELAAGLRPQPDRQTALSAPMTRSVVLMPAHNEAKVISESVTLTLARMDEGMQLLVVADNCTDETANIARMAGAWVVERHDPDRRGKGYALAHGISALSADPPDCVIVIDADAWPETDALTRLTERAIVLQRPIQGSFLIAPDKTLGPITRISNFAHMLKNLVRQRGMSRIAGTGFLCGSGMAFPWSVISVASLANGEIVEDLVLGIRLALSGTFPLFDERAKIRTRSAPGDNETQAQRKRWEHGFVAAATKFAPPLLCSAIATRRREPLWMGLHLMVPPLVMLLGISVLLGALSIIPHLIFGADIGLAEVILGMISCALILIGIAWIQEGRAYLGIADLFALPRYFVAKLGIWTGLVRGHQTNWNRTER